MGRFSDLVGMLARRRVGFRIEEKMKGTHRFLRNFAPGNVKAGVELPFAFSARWGNQRLPSYLRPGSGDFLRAEMEGSVTAGGLCLDAPLSGALELRYFKDATVRYEFEFEAHGIRMRYEGEKRGIRPWNLHRSHTTCYGTVTEVESNEPLSDSVVYFELGALPGFLASLRLE
jgi:hypothetical protein